MPISLEVTDFVLTQKGQCAFNGLGQLRFCLIHTWQLHILFLVE